MSQASGASIAAFDAAAGAAGVAAGGILGLDEESARADGTAPLDDQVRLDLQSPPSVVSQWVAEDEDAAVVGYAHLDLRSSDVSVGHLVVAPSARRSGLGSRLLDTVERAAEAHGQLRIWAHGDTVAAQGFAASRSLQRVRELLRLRLAADSPLGGGSYPDDIQVRTYRPGDEQAWVRVNAAAFVSHPEQGRLTVDDFRQRISQPWFDPAGLFLAERDGELLGFHWTKLHESGPVGEIYVLGVLPEAQGLGLGKALTLTGLRYLRESGAGDIILYVEGDNAPALAVYQRFGFERASADVMYARR